MTTIIEAKFGAVPVIDERCDAVHVVVLTQDENGILDACAGITRPYHNDRQRNARAALVASQGRVLKYSEAVVFFPALAEEQYRS